MRHLKKKKIGSGRNHGRKLVRALAASAIIYEKIQTTEARAKVTRSVVEKLITKGKSETLHSKRQIFAALPNNAAKKVIEVLGPKYKERKGGYTRIIRIGKSKDGMPKVQLELVD
ncbi:MAG: 50S ribosomal protein L17 [Candidatus Doudnabacteria bacterium RIFCSPLOWO2_02_FULL_42_9]|uniref:50S ribosomal protein L17 n=1 Tax=Candidatus Doudnabacteria bacterium RIFCSPHIGHO2_01_FULL_41_86 TaxID=1817821 RepID=A0A1F5N7X3_9BACT|nr:MAG: 50S ribosomal protein L17 [Candidatus Doudnabacteria bacterium RIFCSPHIGHO2_01_FULL_41_86]OGE75684.1 MAG: 50S ribosomal protein L17 [Candidatus Doudnabacteria bacterium RIFCSPHIGHO2_01_43_10]OGE85668.1 MAG: 50S ribosomal protein L17 [Candidatus Doudnabacteria bacterium RIFCSPHIGHO2_12_FULL_42_22]OGE87164.1 MAG: 50S ribosomal protein L17 [Candidatus Doudnabacteria bacterium RIFCSPHIGHO2_02_FULL_42_25]OGE92002.1 MAG: 50S ribosomal protein L17 [Candidatus Doudnabacteria bacterium RIFCSPLOW